MNGLFIYVLFRQREEREHSIDALDAASLTVCGQWCAASGVQPVVQ